MSRTRRLAGRFAVALSVVGLPAGLGAAPALADCGGTVDLQTDELPKVGLPEPYVGPETADPCLADLQVPQVDLGDVEAAASCKTYEKAFVHPWLGYAPSGGLTPGGYGVNYTWTGAGHVYIPAKCASEATVYTQVTNTALLPQIDPTEQQVKGRIKPETERATSTDGHLNPEAIAYVMTGELGSGPPPWTRGPAIVSVKVWGSYLSRLTRTRTPMECRERQFRVQANPATGSVTMIEEIGYGPCGQVGSGLDTAN